MDPFGVEFNWLDRSNNHVGDVGDYDSCQQYYYHLVTSGRLDQSFSLGLELDLLWLLLVEEVLVISANLTVRCLDLIIRQRVCSTHFLGKFELVN